MTRIGRLLSFIPLALLLSFAACGDKKGGGDTKATDSVPTIGLVQIVEDASLDEARLGFLDALKEGGYDESKGTLKVLYRNAQGDQAALAQIFDYLVGQKVRLIGANTTQVMIAAANKTKEIPIFMMVAPSPEIAGLTRPGTPAQANLLGTYETLEYIDTSVALIRTLFPKAQRVGVIYNSSEPNSTNALARLKAMCTSLGLELVEVPVTATNEAQQAAQSIAAKKIDVFFALPDNVMFSSFETIAKSLNDAKVPIITSEASLVQRGALAAYGADFRAWGHQAGEAAARYLKSGKTDPSMLELVKVRKRVINPTVATQFGVTAPPGFEPMKK